MHVHRRRGESVNPGPTLMSRAQMSDYLHDLRTNRPPRPQASIGSVPSPLHSQHYSPGGDLSSSSTLPRLSQSSTESDRVAEPPRSSSSLSHRHSLSLSVSTRSSIDDRRSSTYAERQTRRKEAAEARDVRLALEQIDLQDEMSVMSAAKQEADELIRKHNDAGTPYRIDQKPAAASHARANSSFPSNSPEPVEPLLRPTRSTNFGLDQVSEIEALPHIKKRSSYSKLADYWNNSSLASRRRSSGSRRSVSGKQAGIFVNPNDKIYEDPVDQLPAAPKVMNGPCPQQVDFIKQAHQSRSPFARPRSVKSAVKSQVVDFGAAGSEVVLSEEPPPATPDKSPDPTSNNKSPIEIRSADLRAATSMRLKNRSPKLPSPTAVSDSPSRPIVSFKPDWTPPKADENPKASETQRPSPTTTSTRHPCAVDSDNNPEPVKSVSSPAVPTIGESRPPAIQINNGRISPVMCIPKHPAADYKVPPIPVKTPQISTSPAKQTFEGAPSVPSRNPSRKTLAASVPSIVVDQPAPIIDEKKGHQEPSGKIVSTVRYSPFPKPRPTPPHSAHAPNPPKSNWASPVRRTTALCAQCALPISGRVVTAAGLRFHPSCFTCYHCGEGLECVDFYPEPAEERAARIDRIQRRMNGEIVEDREGIAQADDGDDSLRFYCHLDFHEFFSPRCKSCKTPIEGEVVVACGAEWHVGHFFCAQCGDPFDPSTPFVEKDGYAWCVECHTNRYSSKCKKCKRPVTGTVVQALGGEWHNECFSCTICNSLFNNGRFFLRPGTQDPVCMACEEKRLKA